MTPLTQDDRLAAMAYVDGELPPAQRAAFEARLGADAALAGLVEGERALRAQLRAHYDPVLAEPLPASLPGLLGATSDPAAANDDVAVTISPRADDARARSAAARAWGWREWGGMAASVALGIALGGRALAPAPAPDAGGGVALAVDGRGVLVAQGPLQEALERRVAGQGPAPGMAVAVGLSFVDRSHDFCRTFALAGASPASGIACKRDDRWAIAMLDRATPPDASASTAGPGGGGYRTAGSTLSPTLLMAVDALREGDTLDAPAEAAARARGWRR